MLTNFAFRRLVGVVMATVSVLLTQPAVQAQAARDTTASNATFSQAMARAKQSSQPLIVFGTSEGCSRCAALKQGIGTQSDLKLLLTQYVSIEIPFAGVEFKDIFHDLIRKDAKY